MRLRNVKNKDEIISNSVFVIEKPEDYKGKWNIVFDNDNPIQIEIGMGKGDFIIGKALNNPNINFIGIEKYDSVLARAVEKIPPNLSNLRLVRLDALNIDKIFDSEVDIIYLNFSDPWPKKRHANRRLTSSVFLEKYEKIFVDSKVICQKTDNQALFEYSVVNLSKYGYTITELSMDLHNSKVENNIMTEYEKKFSARGDKIYYLLAKK